MDSKIDGKEFDGIYILRSLLLLEDDMRKAAGYLEDGLFIEYWGVEAAKTINIHNAHDRIRYWLYKADQYAQAWRPSDYLSIIYFWMSKNRKIKR